MLPFPPVPSLPPIAPIVFYATFIKQPNSLPTFPGKLSPPREVEREEGGGIEVVRPKLSGDFPPGDGGLTMSIVI